MAKSSGETTRDGRRGASQDERDADESGGFLPELLRRGLTLGFSGFFLTEEAVRKAFGDTVPKDWVEFAVDQSERTRAELLERMSGEIGRAIQSIDAADVLQRLLDGRTVEVTARFRLLSDEESEAGAEKKKRK